MRFPSKLGGSIGDGDDIAFVEAMKMEIPVASPAAGRLKSILVSIDDVVAEGQVLAVSRPDARFLRTSCPIKHHRPVSAVADAT